MRRLVITVAVAAMAAGVAFAGYNEDVVARMPMQKKRFCDRLSSLSPQSLQAVAQQTSETAIRRRMEELLALDSLAIGTRAVDADGRAAIHRYLLDRVAALKNVPTVAELVTASVPPMVALLVQRIVPTAIPSPLYHPPACAETAQANRTNIALCIIIPDLPL